MPAGGLLFLNREIRRRHAQVLTTYEDKGGPGERRRAKDNQKSISRVNGWTTGRTPQRFFRTSLTALPISAGLFTTFTPAEVRAAIFSAAVPRPPAMIAPAWPIRRPGGAVWPAMNATMGLVTFAWANAAASSSAVPPISPI